MVSTQAALTPGQRASHGRRADGGGASGRSHEGAEHAATCARVLLGRASMARRARFQVAHEQGFMRRGNEKAILIDVDFGDLIAKVRLENDARARRQPLDDHRGGGDVGELKFAFVPHAPDARIIHVDGTAE
eukprot:scaffold2909_cov28-Tisochrysis_lutea.AAC.2